MNARTVVFSMAGLGVLTASCAGMRLPSVPNSPHELGRAVGTASREAKSSSDCSKLDTEIGVQEEYALGGSVAINWAQRGGGLMIGDEAGRKLHQYLNVVGRNLASQSPRPTLQWTFGVLQNVESFDAVSAPGGYVFVTRGLLQGVDNEAQLAGVLAHEIAHITSKHALKRYGQVKVAQCKRAAMFKGGSDIFRQSGGDLTPSAVDTLLQAVEQGSGGRLDLDRHPDLLGKFTDDVLDSIVDNGFGAEDEYQADELAVRLMVSAGYDPGEYIRFLGKISESRSGFDNHPRKSDRVKRLVALLKKAQDSGEDFPELPADTAGLAKPTLPAEFSVVKSAVASDKR
ncbi:M48 family metalloprotease [Hyalangium rubrum]|uniref:M48 family metalloprotease n=1 Tax=Hyalangium rubrum TaxID=3103134 RepID=A0ABU5GXK4_9BACT|nr:M48 family metalloprotease [Hyalangium sp. s54d21]MDY7225915.1 M48 family metalloprotease [Hyalangium sp. s54d21]